VDTYSTFEDMGAGLHVLREAEPLKRAGMMAVSLRADLCVTLEQAETTLAERRRLPHLDASTLRTLEGLARSVARAQRISNRTRERAVVEVGQRLAGIGSGLAVHPATIRDRAATVEAARAALAEAEQVVVDHNAAADRLQAELEAVAAATAADETEAALHRDVEADSRLRTFMRARQSRALGAVLAAFGLGLVLLGLGVALWAALLPTLTASLWATHYLRPIEVESDDDEEELQARQDARDMLALVATATEEAFVGSRLQEEQRALERVTTQRDLAAEQLRVALRSWEELAGEGVDIADLDEVVRRFDPQHEDARLLAGETVGVRTTEVVLRQILERWEACWRELGLDAPSAEWGEEAVRELVARIGRPIVLVGQATERGDDLVRAAPSAAVVVIQGPTGAPNEL